MASKVRSCWEPEVQDSATFRVTGIASQVQVSAPSQVQISASQVANQVQLVASQVQVKRVKFKSVRVTGKSQSVRVEFNLKFKLVLVKFRLVRVKSV